RLLKNRFRARIVTGHDFSRADKPFIGCHPERASAREGSAFPTFSAACVSGCRKIRAIAGFG
ncbi:MAG: hypothetical protein WCC25_08075, partial [Candidatus Korobacteraceae bacterium]